MVVAVRAKGCGARTRHCLFFDRWCYISTAGQARQNGTVEVGNFRENPPFRANKYCDLCDSAWGGSKMFAQVGELNQRSKCYLPFQGVESDRDAWIGD